MPNAVSNQCGPIMMGSRNEEEPVVEMATVSVAGKSYELPRIYSKTFEGVNFEKAPNSSMKLEDVSVACNTEDVFNDEFGVDSYVDADGSINMKFFVDSEVAKPLLWYKEGKIEFRYDSEAKTWSMNGDIPARKWWFCKPDVVIGALISALECSFGEENDEEIKTIRNILADNRANITAGVRLIRGSECNVPDEEPPSFNSAGTLLPNY